MAWGWLAIESVIALFIGIFVMFLNIFDGGD